MRSLLLPNSFAAAVLLILATPAQSTAQILGLPDASPAAAVYERVGVTDMKVVYHRPAVRGRQIWGDVVPYGLSPPLAFFGNGRDFPWRAGANENTTIHFEHDVLVEGEPLPAGKYGLHMIPGEDNWTVIFSSDHSSWGSFFYEEERDALRVSVTPQKGPFAERMGYAFVDQDDAGGVTVALSWEELVVPIRVQVANYQQTVLAELDDELHGRPGLAPQSWTAAVGYCLRTQAMDDVCMKWADTAIQRNPGFNSRIAKARLMQQRGDEAGASQITDAAVATATENELNIFGYQLMQGGDIDRALEMFMLNVQRHPESWNVYDSLAEGYANKGDTQKAIANYRKALEMVQDERQKRRIRNELTKLGAGTN